MIVWVISPSAGAVPCSAPCWSAPTGKPGYSRGRKRLDSSHLSARARCAAQPACALPPLQQHLHLLRCVISDTTHTHTQLHLLIAEAVKVETDFA